MTDNEQALLRTRRLSKQYGKDESLVRAVDEVDLAVGRGEAVAIMGPSGCGKSTLLHLLGALERPSAGEVWLEDSRIDRLSEKALARLRRHAIGFVFQAFHLMEELTAAENVELPALLAGRSPGAARRRAAELLEQVGLADRAEHLPSALSGGQRQRVAIGRAIVRKAELFLFDEPLSNLDAQLRDEMRTEIKRLHHEITTTMIYVTHDQVEAMTLADRIVLLRDGKIEQQGAPLELFERPRTEFVARFLGSPSINLIPAKLVAAERRVAAIFDGGGSITLPVSKSAALDGAAGRAVLLGIRPQHFSRAGGGPLRDGFVSYSTVADLIQPTGTRTFITIKIGGVDAIAELQAHDVESHGQKIELAIDLNRAVLIDPGTGSVIA